MTYLHNQADVDPITGLRIPASSESLCNIESELDNEGSVPPEKMYSASDVETMIKRRLAKSSKVANSTAADWQSQVDELNAKLEAFQNQEGSVKQQDRALMSMEAQNAKLEASLAASLASTEAITAKLNDHVKGGAISKALAKAGVLSTASHHASQLMMQDLNIQVLEENGKQVVLASVDGVDTDNLAEAAASWLKTNSHFASHPGTGTGETPIGRQSVGDTFSALTPESIATSDPGALIQSGLEAALAANS